MIAEIEMKRTAPSIGDAPRTAMSSDFELLKNVRSRYNNAWHANEWEFSQIIENWKFYFGAEGEQWDEEAIRYKTERHMRVSQYNIIRDKVRTMTGMLASDEYDGRYDPITGVRNSGIEAIEFAYETDKELMSYADAYWQVILDGLIHVGIMGIKVSTEKDPRGNIAFVREIPGRWVTDPDWTSNSIYDCNVAWKQGHMTAEQIFDENPDMEMTPQLRTALSKTKQIPRDWSKPDMNTYSQPNPVVRDMYHVIEEHTIEIVKENRLVGRRPDGAWIPFPLSKDNAQLEIFAMTNGITDWQDSVKVVPYEDRIAHLTRICPALSPNKPIAYGKPNIQVKSVPIVTFSFDKDITGRNIGMVSDLLDPQKDLNYAKSKRQELLASAQGGAGVYNRQTIPEDSDRADFESNHNDATRMFGIDGDPKSFMQRIADGSYNPELIRESEEPFSIVDRISGVSAAMSSRTQGSNEPASLFAMKLKVNKVGTLALDKRIKMMRMWEYQSYFLQAQITYEGPERCFTSIDGKKKAILNERLGDGTIKNKIDELPLCSVSITEAEGNLSRQLRDRSEISAMLQAIPKEYREPVAIMVDEAFKTMSLSAEKKEVVNQAMKLEILKARVSSMTEIKQMLAAGKGAEAQGTQADLTNQQLEQQLMQMQMQPAMPQEPQEPETPEMISKPSMPSATAPGPIVEQPQNLLGQAQQLNPSRSE